MIFEHISDMVGVCVPGIGREAAQDVCERAEC